MRKASVKPMLFWLSVFLFFSVNAALSQKTVTGKVVSKTNNQPVVGASVVVKGSKTGTQTNAEGTYSVKVSKESDVLVVSFIGYDPVEIPVAGKTSLDVELTQSVSLLNEILVTGYSAQRKKDITGSVSVVNTKELVANPGSNVESLLQGKAAGVTVGTSGVPGAGASVRIRGFTTFNQNEPLYVVDGARVDLFPT